MLFRGAAPLSFARRAHSMSDGKYMRSAESFAAVCARFRKDRACAVLRTPTAEKAAPAMDAAIDGGFQLAEFTLTTPGCLDRVAEYRAKYDGLKTGKVLVGCGTILDIQDAMDAMDAGSEFLVGLIM
jgi:2-keto-3-deoxy-6-phosphogluconate aldolase